MGLEGEDEEGRRADLVSFPPPSSNGHDPIPLPHPFHILPPTKTSSKSNAHLVPFFPLAPYPIC